MLVSTTLHFQMTVIWPIIEYMAQIWHHLLSKCQTDQIQATQKIALNIIFTCTVPYSNAQSFLLDNQTTGYTVPFILDVLENTGQ